MRILLCNNFVRQGSGIDMSVEIEERVLTALGHDVRLFKTDNRHLDETNGLRRAAMLATALYSFPVLRQAQRELARGSFDLVHIHNTVPLMTGAIYDACRHAPAVVVQHLRNYRAFCLSSYAYREGSFCDDCTWSHFTACAIHRCYRRSYSQSASLVAARWVDSLRGRATGTEAHAYIANSAFTKNQHVRYGLPEDSIHVLHNPSQDLATLLDGQPSEPEWQRKLTFVGSLLRPKGVYVALDLAQLLPEFEFHFVGAGEEMAGMRRRVERDRLANVVVHGLRQGRDKAHVWRDSFLTLIPSLWEEPFGLIVPESFSLGVPVVTTGSGGLRETVDDGETGFTGQFHDVKGTAALIRDLWADETRYRHMRDRARHRYERAFTEEAFGRRLSDTLEGLIAEHRSEMRLQAEGRPAVRRQPPEGAPRPARPATAGEARGLRLLVAHKFYLPMGGPEVYIRELSRYQEAKGHVIVPFAMQNPSNWPSDFAHEFVSEVDLDIRKVQPLSRKVRTAGRILWSFEAQRKVERIIKESAPDLAHLHLIAHQISPSILPILKRHDVPVVMTAHEYKLICPNYLLTAHGEPCEACKGARFYQAVAKKCVKDSRLAGAICATEMYLHHWLDVYRRNVDLFISPSEFVRTKLIEFGFADDQVVAIPNFVDATAYGNEPSAGDYVLFFGRLVPEKGVATLLEAMRSVDDAKLVIVGSGPQEEELRFSVEALAMSNVEFLGARRDAELRDLIADSRLVVVPSEWYEPFGLVTIEAMAASKPVVATDIGATPEVVDHGTTGLLVPPRRPDLMAAAIRYLWSDADTAMAMGREGRRKVAAEFDIGLHYERLMDVYARVRG